MSNFLNGKPNSQNQNQNKSISQNNTPPKIKEDKINDFNNSKCQSNNSISFLEITNCLNIVEQTKGDNSKDKIKSLLSEVILKILNKYPSDLIRLYNFLNTIIGPEYRCPELGVGKETILKCVSKSTGTSDKHIKDRMKDIGDLGTIAKEGKSSLGTVDKFKGFGIMKKTQELTLKKVMDEIKRIAFMKGKDSMDEKEKIILSLFFSSSPIEIKFLVRCLERSFKIGASFKTLISSISRGISLFYFHNKNITIEEKEIDTILQKCIFQISDYDMVFYHLINHINLDEPFENLITKCKIIPGIPIKPMLAKPTTGIKEVLKRFNNSSFTCEFKYDGFRGQIHYVRNRIEFESNYENEILKDFDFFKTDKIQIFSRNLLNQTESYPDVVENFSVLFENESLKHISSSILDCEIVPYDIKTNKILPFSYITSRSRKNVTVENVSIHVCCFLFDILYLNGESVMIKTLEERRKILKDNFIEDNNVKITKYLNSENEDEITSFMEESIKTGCEGLIVKAFYENSEYQPGERNFNWMKLKKDYMADTTIGDSLDLVPIGAEFGKGKRTGFYGSFLLACYNDDMESFETVSMTGAGLKDEDLKSLYQILSNKIIENPLKSYKINSNTNVDVWFEPSLVFEIKTADLSLSQIYTAGSGILNKENKGISLRFPRYIRLREDKKPVEATSSEEIVRMYNEQALNEDNIKKYEEDSDEDK